MASNLAEMIVARLGDMPAGERRAAQALIANYPMLGLKTVAEFSARAGVSSPTILRFVARIGFQNYAEFQGALNDELAAQLQSPLSRTGLRALEHKGHVEPLTSATLDNIAETFRLISPRQIDEIRVRAPRFIVAEAEGAIRACAELVPLSTRLAEVRSLVVSPDLRRHGVATRLVDALAGRARTAGFQSLLALAHDPRFFMRHDFSIVPHAWLPEKIDRDCSTCGLFRHCGQYAMVRPLGTGRPAGTITTLRPPVGAVA